MKQGRVRIIGGQWRGKVLRFPLLAGLRPTPDRVRETLFNWLRGEVRDAVCLDLFAGTGALGFEALSRGAAWVTLVEQNRQQAAALRSTLSELDPRRGEVLQGDAARVLARLAATARRKYNLLFLDPPFASNLLKPISLRLATGCLLADGALIYLESNQPELAAKLPPHWALLNSQKAGQVSYYLAQAESAKGEPGD